MHLLENKGKGANALQHIGHSLGIGRVVSTNSADTRSADTGVAFGTELVPQRCGVFQRKFVLHPSIRQMKALLDGRRQAVA